MPNCEPLTGNEAELTVVLPIRHGARSVPVPPLFEPMSTLNWQLPTCNRALRLLMETRLIPSPKKPVSWLRSLSSPETRRSASACISLA